MICRCLPWFVILLFLYFSHLLSFCFDETCLNPGLRWLIDPPYPPASHLNCALVEKFNLLFWFWLFPFPFQQLDCSWSSVLEFVGNIFWKMGCTQKCQKEGFVLEQIIVKKFRLICHHFHQRVFWVSGRETSDTDPAIWYKSFRFGRWTFWGSLCDRSNIIWKQTVCFWSHSSYKTSSDFHHLPRSPQYLKILGQKGDAYAGLGRWLFENNSRFEVMNTFPAGAGGQVPRPRNWVNYS